MINQDNGNLNVGNLGSGVGCCMIFNSVLVSVVPGMQLELMVYAGSLTTVQVAPKAVNEASTKTTFMAEFVEIVLGLKHKFEIYFCY